jgi:hypothetical protein
VDVIPAQAVKAEIIHVAESLQRHVKTLTVFQQEFIIQTVVLHAFIPALIPADAEQTLADVVTTPEADAETPADVVTTPAVVVTTPEVDVETPAVVEIPADIVTTHADVEQPLADVKGAFSGYLFQ